MARATKDSGIEWIREIPNDWKISKVKNVSKLFSGYAFDGEALSLEGENIVIRIGDIVHGTIDIKNANKTSFDCSSLEDFKIKKNDVLIAMSGATVGKLGFIDFTPENCYINQRVGILRSELAKFLYFCLSTEKFLEYIMLESIGSAQPNISNDGINNYPIPLPPLAEQQKISAFLDKQCSEIDAVLTKTKESIEEYKLLKNAIITQAVTKGIRPNRKMKDSGIEWIGEIPEEWEVCKLKPFLKWKSIKGFGNETVLSLYRDLGVVPKDSRDDNHNVTSLDTDSYKLVEVDDFVINKMKAWQGSMAISNYRGIVSPAYHICSIESNKIYKPYFHHLMRNKSYLPEYERLSGGLRIGQWDLAFDDFCQIKFLIPSLEEQKEIANYVDKKCIEIDTLITKKEQLITELETYKKSLIYEYVTGKKEVQ